MTDSRSPENFADCTFHVSGVGHRQEDANLTVVNVTRKNGRETIEGRWDGMNTTLHPTAIYVEHHTGTRDEVFTVQTCTIEPTAPPVLHTGSGLFTASRVIQE